MRPITVLQIPVIGKEMMTLGSYDALALACVKVFLPLRQGVVQLTSSLHQRSALWVGQDSPSVISEFWQCLRLIWCIIILHRIMMLNHRDLLIP